MVFATVPLSDYRFEEGEPTVRRIASSHVGHRAFCGDCGTPLYTRVEHQPDTLDFSVATLDDPGRVRPGFHIFWASRPPWVEIQDSLPKYEQFRPNGVDLEGNGPSA